MTWQGTRGAGLPTWQGPVGPKPRDFLLSFLSSFVAIWQEGELVRAKRGCVPHPELRVVVRVLEDVARTRDTGDAGGGAPSFQP